MTPAQVILSWAVQRGTAIVPKTAQDQRLKENLTLAQLSDEHFAAVDKLTEGRGTSRYLVPTAHIGFDIFNEERDEPLGDKAPWDA